MPAQYIKNVSDRNGDVFFIIDTVIVVFFSMDYFGRMLTCPSKRKFFLSFMNFIDLLSIIPYYVEVGMCLLHNRTT